MPHIALVFSFLKVSPFRFFLPLRFPLVRFLGWQQVLIILAIALEEGCFSHPFGRFGDEAVLLLAAVSLMTASMRFFASAEISGR